MQSRETDCSGILKGIPVIVLREGFSLYHLTHVITPAFLKQTLGMEGDSRTFRYYKSLPPNTFPTSLTEPKYFSINYYHPYYYAFKKNDPDNVFLNYRTMKPLVLFDGLKFNNYDQRVEQIKHCLEDELLVQSCIDGWLIKDDPYDPWHEIYLFHPDRSVDPHYERFNYSPEERERFEHDKSLTGGFPYGDAEIATISRETLQLGHLEITPTECRLTFNRT